MLSRGTKERNYDVRIEVFQPEAVAVPLPSLPAVPGPPLHPPPALAALLPRLLCVIICFGLMEDKHFMAASRSHGLALTLHRTALLILLPVPLPPPPSLFFAHSITFLRTVSTKGTS